MPYVARRPNPKIAVAVVAVLICAALMVSATFFRSSESSDSTTNVDTAAVLNNSADEQKTSIRPSEASVASRRLVAGRSATERFRVPDSFLPSQFATTARVISPHKMMALTQEEKVWLDRNGFPTLTEVEWSKQAPIDELESAAQSSLAMAALYGERLWETGSHQDYKKGKSVLWDAVVRGSIYAAEAMALRTLKDGATLADGTNANAFEAAGWWLYAGQRGDYYVSEDMGNFLSSSKGMDFSMGFGRSVEIGLEIDAARARLGLPPAARDARPSYDAYVEGRSQQEVSVIPR